MNPAPTSRPQAMSSRRTWFANLMASPLARGSPNKLNWFSQ
eukprot:CAMPEP_0115342200 /NCGR_PEP_ID=MMETSP0270-20121206/92084_1 /TAXON_ID=71861 /ORGANISM="Scrippsiella trochoidea, Strain CCMP3099" /LENGTH=40 /DNA_ID= /DNA_START= /DNA_END= /DNA_ORIENTATION=